MADPFTLFVLASLSIFAIGLGAGWYVSRKDTSLTRANLQIAVGIMVTIVWAISIAAEILIPTYTVSVLIHGIMGAVVGYLFSDDGITFNIGGGD